MKKDIIIFDLDGTLLNTLSGLCEAFNFAISKFGYPKRREEEIKAFIGNGVKKAIQRCLPREVEECRLDAITKVFKKYYEENITNETCVYGGITEELKKIKNSGRKICVVSNKYDVAVKELCKKYFEGLIDFATGESNEVRKKPDPSGIYKALEVVGGKIENTVYIGDSEVDIETAKNAGVDCISVLWGYRKREELEKAYNADNKIIETCDKIVCKTDEMICSEIADIKTENMPDKIEDENIIENTVEVDDNTIREKKIKPACKNPCKIIFATHPCELLSKIEEIEKKKII